MCALLLPSGKSVSDSSQKDTDSVVLQNVEMQADQGRIILTEAGMREALYHDCPEEDFERAKRLVSPQPLAPFATPIEVTEANFGSVRRT